MDNNLKTPNTKIFQPFNGSPNNPLAAQCHYHPAQAITNFDRVSLMPLCPKCISSHLATCQQKGQPAEIESIEQMHLETQQLLARQIISLKEVLNKIHDFQDIKHDTHNSLQDSILHAKQKAQRVLDAFFDQLQHDLHLVTEQDKTSMDYELLQAEKFMTSKLNELSAYDEKIHGPKFLKYLVRIHGTEFIQESEQYTKECHEYMSEISKKQLEINIDDQKLYSLNLELAKFVQIRNAEFYLQDQQKQQVEFHNPYIERSNNIDQISRVKQYQSYGDNAGFKNDIIKSRVNDEDTYVQKGIINRLIKVPSQSDIGRLKVNQSQITVNSFVININDYFEPLSSNKLLHFFEDGTRRVRVYSVDTIINPNKKLNWRDIDLDINFVIPQQHSSVRTTQGQIYMIGGILNQQILNSIWRLDLTSKQLMLIGEDLTTPRYGHVSIFINGKIFIFGGANKQDLNSCECYDTQYDTTISNNKSKQFKKGISQLTPMKYGGKNQTVCSFRQRYILKVSFQGVEIYDISKDLWQQIQINVLISPDCGIVQVNNSSVLIFGGSSQPCPYGQLKIQENQAQIQFSYEPLQDTQNVAGRLTKTSFVPGTLIFQGKLYSVGVKQQTPQIIVGMPDQWII